MSRGEGPPGSIAKCPTHSISRNLRRRTMALVPTGSAVDMLILHYTGMDSAERRSTGCAIRALRSPPTTSSSRTGGSLSSSRKDERAWHAGKSFWAGETDINSRSIGIEIANPGHEFGYRRFPEAADRGADRCSAAISSRATRFRPSACSPIPTWRRCARKIRASCFPWQRLHAGGDRPLGAAGADRAMGRCSSGATAARRSPRSRRDSAHYGYGLARNGQFDDETEAVVARLPAPFPARAGRRRRRPLDDRDARPADRRASCAGLTGRARQCLSPPRQLAGRPLRQGSKGRRGGKSGLHGNTVPGNARRGRPQGKCHRKQTARLGSSCCSGVARVKGWGKSPPRARQRDRHGKPHREQDRIGMARGFSSRPVSGPAIRVGCVRRPATDVPEEWPSRGGNAAIQNPAYRPAGTFTPRARRGRLRWRGSRF